MKSSVFFVAAGALLASASPFPQGNVKVEVKTAVVMVTEYYNPDTGERSFVTSSYQPTAAPVVPPVAPPQETQVVAQSVDSNSVDVPQTPAQSPPPISQSNQSGQRSRPKPKQGGNSFKPAYPSPPSNPPPPPPPQSGDQPNQAYIQAMLDNHNKVRSAHGVPGLAWNDTPVQSAKTKAEGCTWGHDNHGYGQNLAMWTNFNDPNVFSKDRMRDVAVNNVQSWADEAKDFQGMYNNSLSGGAGSAGHFTQMVWKATDSVACWTVACWTAVCGPDTQDSVLKDGVFTTCHYYPQGNILGQFDQNVFPGSG